MEGETTYQRSNNTTSVEDDPEERDVATLVLLRRVGHHNGTLSSPEKTSADTEESTGKDGETRVLSLLENEEGSGVDAVTDTTDTESNAKTETIGKGSSEETNEGEGTVEGSRSIIGSLGVTQTTTTHTTQSVEHARAEEADKGDHNKLSPGMSIPKLLLAKLSASVHPSLGLRECVGILAEMILVLGIMKIVGDLRADLLGSHCVSIFRPWRDGLLI